MFSNIGSNGISNNIGCIGTDSPNGVTQQPGSIFKQHNNRNAHKAVPWSNKEPLPSLKIPLVSRLFGLHDFGECDKPTQSNRIGVTIFSRVYNMDPGFVSPLRDYKPEFLFQPISRRHRLGVLQKCRLHEDGFATGGINGDA